MKLLSFENFPSWVTSNLTGEIVRPWDIVGIYRMVRDARRYLKLEEDLPSWFLV